MDNNFNIILQKLESFIRKYYLFKMFKGLFFVIGLYIFIILFESLIEYFNYLEVFLKTIIFYVSVFSFIGLLVYYFVFPLLSLFQLRKHLSYHDAAKIISAHFPDIKDKLLNALELNNLQSLQKQQSALVIASINQRTNELSPFPFTYAVNFEFLKRNLVFLLISFIVLISILAFTPHILFDGTKRLVNYSSHFEPKSPFQFILLNNNLLSERGKDFKVALKVEGEYIPENMFIKIGDNKFLMNSSSKLGYYNFTIRNVNNALDFQFFADTYYSSVHTILVLPAPVLKSFFIEIQPPSYTGLEFQKVINSGDITVPFGSAVTWTFQTNNETEITFISKNDSNKLTANNNEFSHKRQILDNTGYSLIYKNENFSSINDLNYTINVIPDRFPEIELKQIEDSLKIGAYYFMITVKDDYGFHDLNFVKQIVGTDSSKILKIEKLPVSKNSKIQDVFYYFNFNELDSLEDDSYIEYYFEIRDNDFISGYKPARSPAKIFKPLNLEQIRRSAQSISKAADAAMEKSKKLTEEIKKDIEDFRKRELKGELNEYDKKNFLKNIMEKQKELDKHVEDVLKQNQKKNSFNDQFYQENENIIEKQKQIQELLDQILDDELKELLKQIEELSKQFNDQKFEQLKDKMDLSYKNLDQKLDRTLEMLKRYQVEESVMQLSEDIEKLSEKQDKLSEEKTSKKTIEEKLQKQQKVGEEFKQIKEDFQKTNEKNQELKTPYKMEDFKEDFNQIDNKIEDLKQNMPNNSKNKNQKQEKEISKDMKEMSEAMKDMLNEMNMQAISMNIEDLRQLMDNLSTFSFNQEDVYYMLSKNYSNSPKYPEIVSNQNKIKKDYEFISDSLNALAARVPQMGQIITKESENLRSYLDKATSVIEDRTRRSGLTFQRHIINSANVLALYLDELLEQLQNQQSSGSGKSSQSKPSQAMQGLKQQQEKLKQELEKLLEQMKNSGGKQNGNGMDNQIVKSLAEQEIFNKMLKDLQNGKGISPEADQKLKEIKRLSDKNIEDLINKNITPELLKRNQLIKTRLLESEKSEREQEQEKKRESNEGKKKDLIVPEELRQSLKNNKNYKESLQKNNLNMKKYYQNLSNEYFRIINN
ncbi:MAG: hypothetical protein P1P88_13655 [Bacteroidales bacterium]|nr:hypothetical protein [Bacteroidales bacterium]